MSHHRRVVSTVFLAVVLALSGALVLLLGSTAQVSPAPGRRWPSTSGIPGLISWANDAWPGPTSGSVAVSGTTAVVRRPYDNTYMGAAYVSPM